MTRPQTLPFFARWRSNIFRAPLFLAWTAVCGTTSLAVSLFEKSGRAQHRIAQIWADGCVSLTGARLSVRGAEILRQHPVAVYAANHTSYMDTPVIFATLPFQFRILAKKELWTMPFIGWHLNRSGQIPIDTTNAHTTLSSLGAGVKALRAGMPIFVFPEGGRTPDGNLQNFLSGAAFLAIRAQVPIIPIALSGVYDLLPIHTAHFYPGDVSLSVGEPIATKGMHLRQADELTARLRAAIENLQSPSVTLIAESNPTPAPSAQ
jgi:1-acyl-sn-glycerol-3-phosphate acyltransferase